MIQPHLMIKEGDIHNNCLIMGDPGRVIRAGKLLKNFKKVSENRGFLVYNGEYDGVKVTLASTGIGCPSAAIVITELINCGAKIIIRVGSGGILQRMMKTGELVISTGACKEEKSTQAYVPPEFAAVPDFDVLKALIESAEESGKKYYYGVTMCGDSFYNKSHMGLMLDWSSKGVIGSDMESSMLFTLAQLYGVKAGFIFYGGLNIVKHQKHSDIVKQKEIRLEGERNVLLVALNAIKKIKKF
ncbi:uridine phosphorylase [archaeon CG_4_10_14_0_2_um_filter_Archaea_38_6]|nr:MAG: uridine phosphorylase [archaeon CG_4_10_14_0_2_um_filter_Archaea_38_6]